jgi:hypothetical protein
VTGITKTTNNRVDLKVGAAYSDRLTDGRSCHSRGRVSRRLFAPPSGPDDYAGAVADAAEKYMGAPEGGYLSYVQWRSKAAQKRHRYRIWQLYRQSPRDQRLASAEDASEKAAVVCTLAGSQSESRSTQLLVDQWK